VLTIILPLKDYREVLPLPVNFSDLLQFGESITGASVMASLFSGADPSPQNIVTGAAVITSNTVTQTISAGVVGTTYTLAFIVTTSNSHNYVKIGQLSVIDSSNAY